MRTLREEITTSPLIAAMGLFVLWFLNGIVREVWREYPWAVMIFVSAFLFNAVAFLLGYSLLRPLNTFGLWKGLLYLITATGANWFLVMLQEWRWSAKWTMDHERFFAALPFLVFIPLTLCFLRYLFGVKDGRVIAVGILIGIIETQSMWASIIVYR